jgi:DNA-directed RNA polymerase II subunit RPB4
VDRNLHPFEVAQLINLEPESAEEAKFLIPSLNRIQDEGEIQDMLEDVRNIQDIP